MPVAQVTSCKKKKKNKNDGSFGIPIMISQKYNRNTLIVTGFLRWVLFKQVLFFLKS